MELAIAIAASWLPFRYPRGVNIRTSASVIVVLGGWVRSRRIGNAGFVTVIIRVVAARRRWYIVGTPPVGAEVSIKGTNRSTAFWNV